LRYSLFKAPHDDSIYFFQRVHLGLSWHLHRKDLTFPDSLYSKSFLLVETALKTTFLYQQLTFTQKDFSGDQEDVALCPFPFSPT